ncbi:hypothetical protein E2562_036502 [Oryza meyeriana var. granulata]|uniref:Uncharacterized protein n=1 Tax=Oryza meyeriana var. granulata TaxID=110450 RepID=A0A6G1DCM7_9ORYZ|nr:hypothetical protein E2562_036502 [Oryza meyeriana var. granulata]
MGAVSFPKSPHEHTVVTTTGGRRPIRIPAVHLYPMSSLRYYCPLPPGSAPLIAGGTVPVLEDCGGGATLCFSTSTTLASGQI